MGNPREDLCAHVDRRGGHGVTLSEAFRALGGDQRQIIAAWNELSLAGRIIHTGQYRQDGERTERVYVTGWDNPFEGRYSDDQPRDDHGRWSGGGGSDSGDSGSGGGSGSGSGGGGGLDASGAEALIASIHDSGGFTFDPRSGGLINVGDVQGVAVAVPHTETIVGVGEQVDRAEFISGVADVVEKYGAELGKGAFLGGWYSEDRGAYMVELTEVIKDRGEAIRLGTERNQEGVFDLGTGEYIPTGGTGG